MACLVTLSACGNTPEPEGVAGTLAEGPLTAVTAGPQTYDPPTKSRVVSFGSVILCSTRPGADIQLDRIRYNFSTAPVTSTSWMRTVPVIDRRTAGRDFDWRPLTVSPGFPPANLQQGPYLGTYTKDLEDFDINQPCFGVDNLGSRRQELITAVKAGATGVAMEQIMVDYHVGITDYTVSIPVDLKACGTDVC